MKGNVLVTGAGGFIGGHLVKRLKEEGYYVRGVDIKEPEFRKTVADEFLLLDLRIKNNCFEALDSDGREIDTVYHLAADMGGIGYFGEGNVLASYVSNNVVINTNMLWATKKYKVNKFFFASTACVYPSTCQNKNVNVPLKEDMAIPADPEAGYGWEKLFSEQLLGYYKKDYGLDVRIARFHNVYGPYGTYEGGREKFPAAICRKVALAKSGDTIEVWGDGEQTRTFLYVDDCVEGVRRLVDSNFPGPVNIGSDRLISVNETMQIVSKIAGKTLYRKHLLDKPIGVRGRSSDNTLIKAKLGWEPQTSLEDGLLETYNWVSQQVWK